MPLAKTAAQRPLTSTRRPRPRRKWSRCEAFDGATASACRAPAVQSHGSGPRRSFPDPGARARARWRCAKRAARCRSGNDAACAIFSTSRTSSAPTSAARRTRHGRRGRTTWQRRRACRSRELAARVLLLAGVTAEIASRSSAASAPVDVPMLIGDATKLRDATGWTPSSRSTGRYHRRS